MKPILFSLGAACALLLLTLSSNSSSGERPSDLRQRLHDPSPAVRKQAALTLAEANDADAIPVLIDLLAQLPVEERKPIEDKLAALADEETPKFPFDGDDKKSRALRRATWAAWWRRNDGPALLAALAKHTLTAEHRRQVERLITQLGSDEFKLREQASEQLLTYNRLVLPRLREAVAHRDAEVARRAKRLIEGIENGPDRRLSLSVLRLLPLRKPAGGITALLAYLPYAEDEMREEEVRKSLLALARRDGKLDAALRRGLADAAPKVRALAAEAAIETAGAEGRAAVRPLLAEDVPSVRIRTALALARGGDKEGVAAMIDLLPLLAASDYGQVEGVLYQLAGDTAPKMEEMKADDKEKCRTVWAAWWKDNAQRVDLARLRAQPILGYTLICDNFGGRVFEIDRSGKERWSIGNLQIPIDAFVLPGQRVLITEYQANRVTERDFQGKILWRKDIARPVNAQRLPNGHTFIATEGGPIVEVDRAGKKIYSIDNIPGRLLGAYRWPQGDIVCKTADGQCRFLDAGGKQRKAFVAGHDGHSTAGLDLKHNGHILITSQKPGKVVEFDRDGRRLLERITPIVGLASQAPNDHILVPDYQNKRVYEMDRAGKIVWEYKGNGHFIRARRR
jgi:aryl carrier-like protein